MNVISRTVVEWAIVPFAIHTAHVGSLVSSSKSSLAAAESESAVWAETVRAEKNRHAIVAKCMMESGRYHCMELQHNDAGQDSKSNQITGVCLGTVYMSITAARPVQHRTYFHQRSTGEGDGDGQGCQRLFRAQSDSYKVQPGCGDDISSSVCVSSERSVGRSVG